MREHAFVTGIGDTRTHGRARSGQSLAEYGLLGLERQRTARCGSGFESPRFERQRAVDNDGPGIEHRGFVRLRAVERIADFGSGRRRGQGDGHRLGEEAHVLRGIGNRNDLAARKRIGLCCGIRSTGVIGFRTEFEMQFPTLHQLFVGDEIFGHGHSVERHRSDIGIAAGVVCRNGQRAAVGQAHDGLRELGCGQRKLVRAGADGIEAQAGEDVPRRHLAAVLVADDPRGRRGVHPVQQAARELLCPPRLPDIIVEVGHVVAGFVAVGILPHEPRHVAYVELHLVRFERKEPIQFTDECRAAAEKPGEPVHVVRHEETVVPRRGLGIVAPRGELFERLRPVAVRPAAAEETGRSVEDIGVVERPLRIFPGDVVPAHSPGHAGDRPVVVGIFQRAGDRLALDIGRYKPLCHIVIGTFLIDVRRADHRIERLFGIVSADTFQVGVGNDRRGMVADHRPRLARRERPDRKLARYVVHVEHTADHVVD